ncbi:CoA-transferase family III domain-containing protein [Infundibulicybe gibba]|nr:CoA-transferase family III domain-containing protein [Infundibulicybe gibba]
MLRVLPDSVQDIWCSSGLPKSALARLKLIGDADTAINSSFRLGLAAQISIGLSGLSAAQFHAFRTGTEQNVVVDARHAIIQFHSEAFCTVDGQLPGGSQGLWDEIGGLYKTGDENHIRIHTNFPHHRRGILSLLGVPESPCPSRDIISEALRGWNSKHFEDAASSAGMCASALRSFEEWSQHPQAKALSNTPPVMIIKIGDAPKRDTSSVPQTMPLAGIRVLDFSRVLAGPIAGRALAAYGANVLLVSSPNLPALPLIDVDTSLGKRTTQLDLNDASSHETLRNLATHADVFLQAYRPGGLASKGFGVAELAAQRPGIVCANLTAWGWEGPWKDRRGFDSLVQTATGFNVDEGQAYAEFQKMGPHEKSVPRPLPIQALDHAAGYFLAFGVNAALCKTITEGGSWEVRVSLAAVGQWIRSLGRLAPDEAFGTSPPGPEISDLSVNWTQSSQSPGHVVRSIKHAAILSATPARPTEAPVVLNAHPPSWV